MKFLHTADLHIGKRTEGRSRLSEQQSALSRIAEIAREEKIDLALIAGDVFDVPSPSAEAKRTFYRFALELSSVCSVVAISGNHDSAADLSAPNDLAEAADIRLIGAPERLTYIAHGEKINVGALPYPDEAVLRGYDGEFSDRVKAYISEYTSHFEQGENNILLSHLFMTGSSEEADENTLGPARMLPKTVLPEDCYSALGHIHKPSAVSKSRNAYYSGSPLNYHFDGDNDKSVIVAEMSGGKVIDVRRIPIGCGRKLVTEEATDFAGAVEALGRNEGNLVKLRYVSRLPLGMTEIKELRSYECFVKLEPIIKQEIGERTESLKTKSDDELFAMYYENYYHEKPTDGIMSLFAEILAAAKGEQCDR